jgi:acetoin utilization protein AcuB
MNPRVNDYMTRKVETAAPDDGIREVFFRMRYGHIRHMPVLEGARLVGIISDRDLRRPDWVDEAPDLSHDYQLDDGLSVGDLMTRNPITVHTYDDLATACELIIRHGFGALPVLDKGGHLTGIISKADLVRAFAHLLANRHALRE